MCCVKIQIETFQLYVIQLRLEDLHNPLALLSEQQNLVKEKEASSTVKRTSPELINMMMMSLIQLIQEDKLTSVLSIRKGKVSKVTTYILLDIRF